MTTITTSYATASAGMHPSHTLPQKLYAIAEAGFKYVEIAFPDLEAYAELLFEDHAGPSGGEVRDVAEGGGKGGYKKLDEKGEGDVEKLIETAKRVRAICVDRGLRVLTVMPFSEFEGYTDTQKRSNNLSRARTWLKILTALDCQMLQVGSSDDPTSSSNHDVIAKDLRALADEAAQYEPPIRIAYEMWAWGVHINSWELTWEICQKVDRENFGLCLDTFQISAIYAASTLKCSPIPPLPSESLASSLSSLTETFSKPENQKKIFYFQISDGALPPPSHGLSSGTGDSESNADVKDGRINRLHKDAEADRIHTLYAWSNGYRPLPLHDDVCENARKEKYEGFLPVLDVIRAVVKTGWRGPWSYEVFYKPTQSSPDADIPKIWTRDAMRVHERVLNMLKEERLLG